MFLIQCRNGIYNRQHRAQGECIDKHRDVLKKSNLISLGGGTQSKSVDEILSNKIQSLEYFL